MTSAAVIIGPWPCTLWTPAWMRPASPWPGGRISSASLSWSIRPSKDAMIQEWGRSGRGRRGRRSGLRHSQSFGELAPGPCRRPYALVALGGTFPQRLCHRKFCRRTGPCRGKRPVRLPPGPPGAAAAAPGGPGARRPKGRLGHAATRRPRPRPGRPCLVWQLCRPGCRSVSVAGRKGQSPSRRLRHRLRPGGKPGYRAGADGRAGLSSASAPPCTVRSLSSTAGCSKATSTITPCCGLKTCRSWRSISSPARPHGRRRRARRPPHSPGRGQRRLRRHRQATPAPAHPPPGCAEHVTCAKNLLVYPAIVSSSGSQILFGNRNFRRSSTLKTGPSSRFAPYLCQKLLGVPPLRYFRGPAILNSYTNCCQL